FDRLFDPGILISPPTVRTDFKVSGSMLLVSVDQGW
ncbi:MAG: hypothetical protein ACI9W1_000918, partial [Candidatus Azotimanducaceae bacterium]